MAATTQTEKLPTPIERTEHPHIVRSSDALGGKARIDGTRISVFLIWSLYNAGTTVADVISTYPWLTPAQVHDALSYAYDHHEEMRETAERMRLRSVLREYDLRYYGGFLLRPEQPLPPKVPAGTPVYTWETLPPDLDR